MDLLEKLKGEVDSAEVFTLSAESLDVSFTAGEIKSSQRKGTFGTALRVIKDGRIGFSSAVGIEDEEQLIKNALESAEFGDKVEFDFAGPAAHAEVQTYHDSVPALTTAEMIEMGNKVVQKLKAVEPGLQVNVHVGRYISESSLATTNGAQMSEKSSVFALSASIERIEGDDILLLGHSDQSCRVEDFTEEVPVRIIERLEIARNIIPLESGKMPAIFPPRAMITLLLPLMQGTNGKMLAQGSSPLEGKIGEKIFDEKFTLHDDPTLDMRPGSSAFDGEGIPCRRLPLVEKGVLKNFVLDLKTASQTGMKPTGSARRGLTSMPGPGTSNLVMEPGEMPLADMLSGVKSGLWVDTVLGIGMGNIISGAFSNTLGVAFKIENGKLVGRVKNVNIAGNIYELLKNIAALSKETEWFYGSLNLPYLMLDSLPVVAK
jgi:PmbA protein